jgi:hypothetical protein
MADSGFATAVTKFRHWMQQSVSSVQSSPVNIPTCFPNIPTYYSSIFFLVLEVADFRKVLPPKCYYTYSDKQHTNFNFTVSNYNTVSTNSQTTRFHKLVLQHEISGSHGGEYED